jgi:hypothetical protein
VLLPSGIALLVAVVATVAALSEVLAATRMRRSVRGPHLAAIATVGVFAVATAALLGVSATASLGRPARSALLPQPALQPEALLVVAGVAALAVGLVRADRTARTAERSGDEVAQAVRTTNVVLVLAGLGLVVLGAVALAV